MATTNSSTPLMCLEAVALDTEATGLDAANSRVIQIGAINFQAGKIIDGDRFDTLVNPALAIPPATTEIHGITDEMVSDAAPFEKISADLEKFVKESIIVGHNVGFDLAILKHEYGRARRPWFNPRSLDTLMLSRIVRPTLADFSLDTIAEWLGIEIKGRHTALGDAIATAQIFEALIPLLKVEGIRTLAEAEQASRSFSDLLEQHHREGWVIPVRTESMAEESCSRVAMLDSFPYRHRVRDVMSSPPVFAEADWPVSQAGRLLTEKDISSAFVKIQNDKNDYGIVTERDLMRALSADPQTSKTVADIMSKPLATVEQDSFFYRALGRMRNLGYRHLGVKDSKGELVGALTSGDLLKQRAGDAILLGDEIDSANSTQALAAGWARLPIIAQSLITEDVHARDITAILAEELCALTRRATQLAEQRMKDEGHGEPPLPYAVLVLGSGGRGETMLSPDQDTAIIYTEGKPDSEEDKWFKKLADYISDIQNDVGIPYCNGGVMAKNPEWRHDIEGWKSTIDGWIGRSEWKDVCYVDIFYDFRLVYGDESLAHEIWTHAYDRAHKSPGFQKQLAITPTDFHPPFGLLGNIKTQNNRVDIKMHGILALVSGARLLGIRHGIYERSTKERLEGVRDAGKENFGDLSNIIDAHEILLRENLEQQLIDVELGIPPSNKVDIKRLPERRRSNLKWALKQVEVMVSTVGDPMAFG